MRRAPSSQADAAEPRQDKKRQACHPNDLTTAQRRHQHLDTSYLPREHITLLQLQFPTAVLLQSIWHEPLDILLYEKLRQMFRPPKTSYDIAPLDVLPRCARGEAREVHPVIRAAGALLLRVTVGPATHPEKTIKRGKERQDRTRHDTRQAN